LVYQTPVLLAQGNEVIANNFIKAIVNSRNIRIRHVVDKFVKRNP